MKRKISTILVLGLSISSQFALLAGCDTGVTPGGALPQNGGGPVGGAQPNGAPIPVGQTFMALAAFDRTGTLRSDGAYTSMLATNFVSVGDEGDTNLAQRAFVSVVLNQIPPGANISKAMLRIRRFISEGNPYADFGAMTVDHVNIVSSINAGVFFGNTLKPTVFTINPQAGQFSNAVMEMDITEFVKADLAAGRPITSFRFQFNNGPSLDGSFDQVFFHANQNDDTLQPSAVITVAQ